MLIDLHVHTKLYSSDSDLDLLEVIKETKEAGLDGVCLADHDEVWTSEKLEALSMKHGLVLIGGLEVKTDYGHVLVFGLNRYVKGMYYLNRLRRMVDEVGGAMVLAHPMRKLLSNFRNDADESMVIEAICKWPVFDQVDAIEVLNGSSTEDEIRIAYKVCEKLALRGTGGSDAHYAGAILGVGCYATQFENRITNIRDLIRELKTGGFRPVNRHGGLHDTRRRGGG